MDEVDTIKDTKKANVVEMKFKNGTKSSERLRFLKIDFSRERVDENQYGECVPSQVEGRS